MSALYIIMNFNPRAPGGARQLQDIRNIRINEFQSTRPVWGATQCGNPLVRRHRISIHAPRVGRDGGVDGEAVGGDISIHAPRVGRDCRPPPH